MNSNSTENHSEKPPLTTLNSERRSSNWDIKNAPKNYISLIITQGAGSFFALASVLLLTQTLGSAGYGGIVAVIAASQIALILVHWTSFSVTRFGAEEFVEKEHISRIFWVRLFIFFPNLLLVLLASDLWFPPLAYWLKLSPEMFYLVILHFIATALWFHVQFSLQGVKLQRLQGGLLAVERLIIFLGLVIFWANGNLNPFTAMMFYIISPVSMVFVGIWFLRKYIFSRFSVEWEFLRRIFAYSIPLLPFSLIGYFSGSYFDTIFISEFLSTKYVGIYAVATQINGIVMQFPTLANSLLIPFFVTLQTENRSELLNRYFQHVFPLLTLLGGVVFALVAFASYFLVPIIFGQEFSESVLPLWILLMATTLGLPVLLGYAALVHSSAATYIATINAITAAITNVTANLILIPIYGMKGCAWATTLTYFAGIVTFGTLLRRKVQIPISWIYIAILPSIFASIVFTYFQNPWTALMACIISTMIIVFVKKNSIIESFETLKKVRKVRA